MAEVYLGVGIDASGAQQGAAQFSNATDKVVNSAKSADKATEKFNQQLQQAQLYFKLAGTAAAYFVTREISAYTKALSDAQAVTNATASEMARLTKVTRELGASTSFSAAQAAEGAKFLGQAGFTVNEIVAALPATMDLAAAATLEMGQASEITANIMSGFGLAATEVGQAADVLAAISSNANTDVTGMGDAMKYVGPIANSLGISMEDTAAAVGVLANAGIQGTMAGTGLRSSLSSLLTPTAAAKKAIKELGIDIKDLNPNANSLQDIIKRLADAGLDAERAFTIFGERGATSMIALTSNVPMLERLTEVTNNAQGAARRMAEIKLDNIAGDFEKLSGEIAETALKLGDAGLTGAIRKYLQVATTWVESLNKSIEGITSNREQMQLLADAVNVLKNALIVLMSLKIIEWLFAAGNAMRLLNIAMSVNPWVVAATAAGTLGLELVDLKKETNSLEDATLDQVRALRDMEDQGSKTAGAARKGILEMQKAALLAAGSIDDINKQIAERQAQRSQREGLAGSLTPKSGDYVDPGTAAMNSGFYDPIVAELNARKVAILGIDKEIAAIDKKSKMYGESAYKGGRQVARSFIDGVMSITQKDVVDFFSQYVPGISSESPTTKAISGTGEKAKESFMVGELANLKLQLELTKNLGASEADLYRIRLNDEALREAKEAGLKRITDTMKNQINTAVALFAEENKLKESYETQKKFTDALKEKLKTSESAVTAAQNLGASESELLRINLEAQATEAARKAGLQGISAEWQTMIDKIVTLAAIQKEAKDAFETGEKQKKYIEDLKKAFEAEEQRAKLLKEYGKNLSEVSLQMEIYNALKEKNVAVGSDEASVIEKQIKDTKALKKANDDNTEATKKAEEASKQWANSMKDAFKDAIMNSKNLGDALSNLANRVQDMLVNKALDSLLGGMFKSIGFAKGAAFQAGGVTAFASGGIVSQPSFFPMSGNRTGLMGEAGPEAIMPLTRTSSGDLGVRAIGGGGTTVIAPVVNISVSGGSEEQNQDAATKVSAAVRDAIDDVVMNVLLREKRPGGSLT